MMPMEIQVAAVVSGLGNWSLESNTERLCLCVYVFNNFGVDLISLYR